MNTPLDEIQRLAAKRAELRVELEGINRQLSDLGVDINSSHTRGGQKFMAETLGVSRETVRNYGYTYYRSVIRRDGDAIFVSAPSDASIRTDVTYEIRDHGKGPVLGHVSGRDLLHARQDQLAAYIAEDPSRTNISLVDVNGLLE